MYVCFQPMILGSVDEEDQWKALSNWGYDPVQYNVPEAWVDPNDPYARILWAPRHHWDTYHWAEAAHENEPRLCA